MSATATVERVFSPRGAASRLLFDARQPEVLISGPAGTGKSRAALEYVHKCLLEYPKARALVVRKTLTSLVASGMVTFREKVLDPRDGVQFYGGSKVEPAQFRYPNGSRLVVGGLDKASKIMSAEYDIVYVQEATELTENDWESLTTRLRNGMMPFQQMVADCNPDAPTHWLKRRSDAGRTVMLESRHEDNPVLYDRRAGVWTDSGAVYMSKLDNLSGVRYLRLRKGVWAAAEGMVYDNWDRAVHLIDRFPIPPSWRRFRVVDFGYTNPFVCQWWAIDPDGRMYLYREIYHSQRTVKVHAEQIKRLESNPFEQGVDAEGKPRRERIERTVADHDAEDRATLAESGIHTENAKKDVTVGIQAVQERLKLAGDGRGRLFILRDSLVERDGIMADAGKPTCTAEEIESYCWPQGQDGKPVKEEPVKVDDHGMDALRYAVMYVDGPQGKLTIVEKNPLFW